MVNKCLFIHKSRLQDTPYKSTLYPYVQRGYRMPGDAHRAARSILQIHNETCNIWSHIGGCALMSALIAYTIVAFDGPALDLVLLLFFLASAALCMFCSVVYHTMAAADYATCRFCHAVDCAGVGMLMGASHLLIANVECEAHWPKLAIGAITLAVAKSNFDSIVQDSPWQQAWTNLVSVGFALVGLLIWSVHRKTPGADMANIYAPYAAGAIFKYLHFPDPFVPTRYNWFIHGHTLFHVCVVVGAYSTWATYFDLMKFPEENLANRQSRHDQCRH